MTKFDLDWRSWRESIKQHKKAATSLSPTYQLINYLCQAERSRSPISKKQKTVLFQVQFFCYKVYFTNISLQKLSDGVFDVQSLQNLKHEQKSDY